MIPFLRLKTFRHPLSALLLVYAVLAILYSAYTPPFEAPDEYYHFAVIEHLHRAGTLPNSDDVWRQMRYHAPLYYLIGAALIAPLDTSDFPDAYPLNPHAQIGVALATDNQNFVAHAGSPRTDAAVRVVRGFSILLGGLTLVSVYALARGVFFAQSSTIFLLAVGIVLFNPQFLFLSGVISNDNLVVALATLCLALLVWAIRRGIITIRVVALISILAAFASLSKASGLTLYPVLALGMGYACWRARSGWRRLLLYALIGVGAWVLIAGWWYWGNFAAYGDFSAATQVAAATGLRGGAPIDLIGELRGLYFSYWGLFGWFNVAPPRLFYDWTLMLIGISVIGLIIRVVSIKLILRRDQVGGAFAASRADDVAIFALLVSFAVIVIGAWWQFNTLVMGAQGRLWFPLLGVFAAGLAWGLSVYPRLLRLMLLAGMALACAVFPFMVLSPAYTPAPPLSADWQPPPDALEFRFREPWNEQECLILWATPLEWDGESPIRIDLYWQSLCGFSGYWSAFAHFVDLRLEGCVPGDTRYVLAQVDTMPQGGRLPLPAFQPGKVYHDTLWLIPPPDLDLSREWHVQVGLYDAGGTFMRAFISADQTSADLFIGQCAPETVNYRLRR